MNKKMSWLVLAVFLMILASFLFIKGRKEADNSEVIQENEKIVLRIYAQYLDEDTRVPYDYAVEKLAEAFPEVELILDEQAQDDGQKLQTYAATGNLPDIYQAGRQQIEVFKESDNIMVLNDAAEKTGFIDKIAPGCENVVYHEDGNIYAFPYSGNEVVLWYYNREIFDRLHLEPPETFDELLHVVKVLRKNGIIPLACFGKEKWITTAIYDIFATRFEAGGIDKLDQGEIDKLTEGYEKAAQILHDLTMAGMFPDNVVNLNYDQAVELFYGGKAAMMINGHWEIESSYERMGDKVDWMYYPSYSKEAYKNGKNAWAGGGSIGGYAVNPNSEHKELAAEVAAFLSEKYCEIKYLYRGNSLLALKVDGEPQKAVSPMRKRLEQAVADIQSMTKFTWGLSNSGFKVGIEDQSQLLLTPQYSPEEFIIEMNKILKNSRETEIFVD